MGQIKNIKLHIVTDIKEFISFNMKLRRFLLRYYPPGIILEYEQSKVMKTKSIDLLDLQPESDVSAIVHEIMTREPLITTSRLEQLSNLISKLQKKLSTSVTQQFYFSKYCVPTYYRSPTSLLTSLVQVSSPEATIAHAKSGILFPGKNCTH